MDGSGSACCITNYLYYLPVRGTFACVPGAARWASRGNTLASPGFLSCIRITAKRVAAKAIGGSSSDAQEHNSGCELLPQAWSGAAEDESSHRCGFPACSDERAAPTSAVHSFIANFRPAMCRCSDARLFLPATVANGATAAGSNANLASSCENYMYLAMLNVLHVRRGRKLCHDLPSGSPCAFVLFCADLTRQMGTNPARCALQLVEVQVLQVLQAQVSLRGACGLLPAASCTNMHRARAGCVEQLR
jgi:hypothetical protein